MPGTKRNQKKNKRRNKQHHKLEVEQSSQHSDLAHCSNELTAATCDGLGTTVTTGALTGMSSDVSSTRQAYLPDTSHVTSFDNNLSHQIREKEMKTSLVDDNFLLNIIDSTTSGRAILQLLERNSFSQDGLDKALISACRQGHKFVVQALIRAGAIIHCKDSHGNTPLLICAENGFTDIVRFLVMKKADINAANSAGNTALILSIRSAGSTDLTKFLLEQKGVDCMHQNRDGYTALMKALEVMDVDTVTILLAEYFNQSRHGSRARYVFEWDKKESTIQIAVQSGLEKVFGILQEHIKTRTSPLELAIQKCDTESFDILLDCQVSYTSSTKKSIDDAFRKLFTKSYASNKITFNDTEIKMITKLLEYGVKVNTTSYYDAVTPISAAVEAGNYYLVELLCKHGAGTNCVYRVDSDPLSIAAKNGRIDLIELLLKYNTDINQFNFSQSALNSALIHGHIDCAKCLIQHGSKMDIECALKSAVDQQMPAYMNFLFQNHEHEVKNYFLQQTNDVTDLLISAVKGGNLDILGQILGTGTNINKSNLCGETPLAASKNRQVAEFLIQRGAHVNREAESMRERDTPLIQVLGNIKSIYVYSIIEVVQVLLENGASVNGRSCDGKTPLMMAASEEVSTNILQTLLDHGADVNEKDEVGNTALISAVVRSCSQNASCLIQFSKDNKNLINLQNYKGLTALMHAVQRNIISVTEQLINAGADVNIKDVNGNTALLHAVTRYRPEERVVKTLVSAGSDVNCQNNDGHTPLMVATLRRMKPVISVLLDLGADVNAVSNKDCTKTALSFLSNNRQLESDTLSCMESLLDRGASSSYVSPDILHKTILQGQTEIMLKLIRCGLGPAEVRSDMLPQISTELAISTPVSPLCVALLVGNAALARYFVGNLFLTTSDLSLLSSNTDVRRIIERKRHQDCLNFLDEISSQPMSLFKLALVTVSSVVGASPGRETRVNMLLLPQMMKDKLLFKSEDTPLTIPAENKVSASSISLVDLSLAYRFLVGSQFERMRHLNLDDYIFVNEEDSSSCDYDDYYDDTD